MTRKQKHIQGRSRVYLPNLHSAMVAVSKRTTWSRTLGLLILLVFVSFGGLVFILKNKFLNPSNQVLPLADDQSAGVAARHPLTGDILATPLVELPKVMAVMIENSFEAWPLSGINQAFLVIEAPVEGNIPRFIAFFSSDQLPVEKIGPVRSARPYYLDWASEFGALYAHVGGSPEALGKIDELANLFDLDQFFESEYFWRDNETRFAPHNVYTSTKLLVSALTELAVPVPAYDFWSFKDPVLTPEVLGVYPVIDWTSGSTYDVAWRYDISNNRYVRLQGQELSVVTSGENIYADNIIIMKTDIDVVDEIGRRKIITTGTGEAVIYQDGIKILATWRKDEGYSRLKFFDSAGQEVFINKGKTWIEVVSSLESVTDAFSNNN